MRFGPVPVEEALGATLAHSMQLGRQRLKKGIVLSEPDLAALSAAGVAQVTVARLDPNDVAEDAAAAMLAEALVPDPRAAGVQIGRAFTGRVNLHATRPGLLRLDADAVHALNRIDPAITLATLTPLTRVRPRMLVGTVKIISYAVPGCALQAACAAVDLRKSKSGGFSVLPVQRRRAGLILTEVPGQKPSLSVKGRAAVEARLHALGMELAECRIVAHESAAIAAALPELAGDLVLILTGSATSDLRDTAPEGVRAAGGHVARFGMPVDPGNLLFTADLNGRPVIGLPGCARSLALNGADWVLERIACGLEVSDDDIAEMGVGGLLKEIPIRPQPREG
ncbi:MAG: molybdopterin-binding protein [Celeribacter sp.]|jgi:molybdenum cofactor cytidylyltransferase